MQTWCPVCWLREVYEYESVIFLFCLLPGVGLNDDNNNGNAVTRGDEEKEQEASSHEKPEEGESSIQHHNRKNPSKKDLRSSVTFNKYMATTNQFGDWLCNLPKGVKTLKIVHLHNAWLSDFYRANVPSPEGSASASDKGDQEKCSEETNSVWGNCKLDRN